LFKLSKGLTGTSNNRKKKFLAENSEESDSVHYSDEISNCQFILDFAKVVDFVEETKNPETFQDRGFRFSVCT